MSEGNTSPEKRSIHSQNGGLTSTFVKPEFMEQAKKNLDAKSYEIMVERGTERAYTGEYDKFFKNGDYYCKICNEKLFGSEDKFDSGCGWPAFSKGKGGIAEKVDTSYGMRRVETVCANCGAHLGHVFNDGPIKTGGMRYCINSACLNFKEEPKN